MTGRRRARAQRALARAGANDYGAGALSNGRRMNRFDPTRPAGEARIRYLDNDYQILSPGSFVRCAVTGQPIGVDELKYWSVERQEAYVDAAASLQRHRELAG